MAPCLPLAPSDIAVHILAAFMLLLAILSTFIQIWHRFSRRNLRLRHEPGTIASAVAIGGQTSAGALLSGQRSEKDLSNVLRGKKFRIEPLTMKIIMEGEDGYEDASSPGLRRRSVFYGFQQGLWLKDNGEEVERGEGLGGHGRSIRKRMKRIVERTSVFLDIGMVTTGLMLSLYRNHPADAPLFAPTRLRASTPYRLNHVGRPPFIR